jgi:hypothetical protein
MKILVDACAWSLALRRSETADCGLVEELTELIAEHEQSNLVRRHCG